MRACKGIQGHTKACKSMQWVQGHTRAHDKGILEHTREGMQGHFRAHEDLQ